MFTHSHSLTPSILVACGRHLGNSWQKGTSLASCSMELVSPDLLAPCPQGNEKRTLRRSSSRKGRSHLTFFPAPGIAVLSRDGQRMDCWTRQDSSLGRKQCKKERCIRALMGQVRGPEPAQSATQGWSAKCSWLLFQPTPGRLVPSQAGP